ncbi:hypothetical protein UCRPC4_g04144 [Phaeomoniella chlamydospora]|uniref:Uncharacterized protein n=1 Tax=Phaeomoniella chlamydospora TaxID=158046 RepID=A0A0G2ECL4_PHACM|nr:hypothetical protein UCRPC4_g04144 [Phaeomoniella chlamydospora]
MGRKPNALILHYFHRGPKLEDASNRYQHTCKACGEDFPKGRIDSLQNHLTKKCPALSVSERTHVVLQIHNVQLGATAAAKKENAKAAKENKAPNAPPQNRTPQQTFDGLNVLAEASRQVGQVERRGSQAYPQVSGPHEDPMNMAIDPALDVFPHSFPNTFDHELGSFSQTHVPTSNAMSTIPPLPHLPTENAEDDQPHAHNMPSPPPENGDVSMTNQPDNELSTIAADANELLPANPPQGSAPVTTSSEAPQSMDPDISDKHTSAEVENVDRNQVNRNLGNETAHADNPVQEPVSHAAADIDTSTSIATQRTGTIQGSSSSIEQMATDGGDGLSKSGEPWINFDGPHFQAFYEEMQRASQASETPLMTSAPQQRPIAARSDFKAGEFGTFTLDTHPPAKATRQKFSANRRKEVQDVRKVGACLRCRMLRKPCSLESPCATCRNVESARLWKEPCMRVRITELFDLYAAGLHASLAYRDISLVKGQLQFEQVHGQVVAAHSNESDNAVNVKALQGRIDSTAVGVPLIGAVNVSLAAQEVKLLDADGEDVLTKVSHYLQSNGGKLYESEPSHIIRSTLLTLAEMNEENKVSDGLRE